MGPRSAETDAKRTRILRATRAICARRGFDAARMEEIARAARVSKGTLYRFFRSKEDLFLATVLESYERGHRIVASETPRGGGPRARLAGLLRAMTRALPEVSAQMTVNFQAWGVVARDRRARARLSAALREVYAQRTQEILEALRAGQRSGVFRRELDPEAFVAAVIATFDGMLYRSTFDPEHANAERLEQALAILLETLLSEPLVVPRPARVLPHG